MKKILSLLLAVVLSVSSLPLWVSAENMQYATEASGTFSYTVENDEVIITDYISGADIVIPSEIDGYPVTTIGEKAFYNRSAINSITLPDTITTIEKEAFASCTMLVSVNIPSGVTEIPEYAFRGCKKLTTVNMSDNVTSFGDRAFSGCSGLANPPFSKSLTYIGKYAFAGCKFVGVAIPVGVEEVDDYAFSGCSKLEFVMFPSTVVEIGDDMFKSCSNFEKVYYALSEEDFEKVEYNNLKMYIYTYNLIYDCGDWYACGTSVVENGYFNYICIGGQGTILKGEGTELIIPEEIDGHSITKIENYAFKDCEELETICIPETVTEIGYSAFENCYGLKSVNIPYGVTEIKADTFEECKNLESIVIPDTVKVIRGRAFSKCKKLREVEIPYGVESIGEYAFDYACFEKMVIPDSVTSIGAYAFKSNGALETVYISSNVQVIERNAFSGCGKLSNLTFGENSILQTIGYSAFSGCSIKSLDLPDSVTYIDERAFAGCKLLESLDLPSSLQVLEVNSFLMCTSLKSVVIPEGVTEIYGLAFSNCSALKEVRLPASLKYVAMTIFDGCENLETIYYYGSKEDFAKIENIGNNQDALDSYELVYMGDADGDDSITASDVLTYRKYCACIYKDEDINYKAADINIDGQINAKDLLLVRKYLSE